MHAVICLIGALGALARSYLGAKLRLLAFQHRFQVDNQSVKESTVILVISGNVVFSTKLLGALIMGANLKGRLW